MKRHFLPPTQRSRFNMTPLVDVVFLLMIFFMATAQFQREAKTADVKLPAARQAQRAAAAAQVRLTVNVVEPGWIMVRGRRRGEADLNDLIGDVVAESNGQPVQVTIRSDREVEFGVVRPILVACARNGIWNVNFAVVPKRNNGD